MVNRDIPLVPLLSATRISVCQMRKWIKLSVMVEFLPARVLASKQLFIHPWQDNKIGTQRDQCRGPNIKEKDHQYDWTLVHKESNLIE